MAGTRARGPSVDARALLEKLNGLRDVGLLSEERDTANARLLNAFPPAFSQCRS